MVGRIGDTPIIGAGTYANHLCAVSATGKGEAIIRATVARDVAALVEYKGLHLRMQQHMLFVSVHLKVLPAWLLFLLKEKLRCHLIQLACSELLQQKTVIVKLQFGKLQ